LEKNEKVFDEAQELVNLFQQLKRQKEAGVNETPSAPPTREEREQNQDNLRT